MKSISTPPSETGSQPVTVPELGVVIIYEDYETGLRAKKALDRVLRPFYSYGEFELSMWKFELLRVNSLREQAALEAAKAHLIWISAHGERDLPDEVKAWIDQWLSLKSDQHCALVVSLDGNECPSADGSQTLSYLQKVAKRADVELLPKLWKDCDFVPAKTTEAHSINPQDWLRFSPAALFTAPER